MGNISYKEQTIKKLTCDHPLVERIWEYGGLASLPTGPSMYRIICLKIKGIDDPIQFEDEGDGQAILDAEKYLKQLQP